MVASEPAGGVDVLPICRRWLVWGLALLLLTGCSWSQTADLPAPAPRLSIRAQVLSADGRALFQRDEPLLALVTVTNQGYRSEPLEIGLRVVDYFDAVVHLDSTVVHTDAGSSAEHRVALPPLPLGWFSVEFAFVDRAGAQYAAAAFLAVTETAADRPADPHGPLAVSAPHLNADTAALVRSLGVQYVDGPLNGIWRTTHLAPGLYRWGQVDDLVALAAAHDLTLIGVTGEPPGWVVPGGYDPTLPIPAGGPLPYVQFNQELARRYAGRLQDWVPWVGPNVPEQFLSSVEHYSVLHRLAARAMLPSPGPARLVSDIAGWDAEWLEQVLSLGTAPYIDAIRFGSDALPGLLSRPGADPFDAQSMEIRHIRSLIDRHGGGIALWYAGMSGPAAQATTRFMEPLQQQARMLVKSHLIALAEGVERIFVPLYGAPWGLLSDAEPRPALLAYRVMARELAGKRLVGLIEDPATRAYVAVLQGGGQTVAVAWSEAPEPQRLWLPLGPGPVTRLDMMGGQTELSGGAGPSEITLSQDPVYLQGVGFELVGQAVLAQAGAQAQAVAALVEPAAALRWQAALAAAVAAPTPPTAAAALAEADAALAELVGRGLTLADSLQTTERNTGTALLHRITELRTTMAHLLSLLAGAGLAGPADAATGAAAARHAAMVELQEATAAIAAQEWGWVERVQARRLLQQAAATLDRAADAGSDIERWALAEQAAFVADLAGRLAPVEGSALLGIVTGSSHYLLQAGPDEILPVLVHIYNLYPFYISGEIAVELPAGWTLHSSRSFYEVGAEALSSGGYFNYAEIPIEIYIPPDAATGVYPVTVQATYSERPLPPLRVYIGLLH